MHPWSRRHGVFVCPISFDGASNDSWLRFARPVTRILATVNKVQHCHRKQTAYESRSADCIESKPRALVFVVLLIAAHTFAKGLFGVEQTCVRKQT